MPASTGEITSPTVRSEVISRPAHDSSGALAWLIMRIPIELAETLAAVLDEGTLDAAARRLQVTPSAVSQRLKSLEEQLGGLLVVRSKPVRLTEAGEAVVRLARQIALLEHDALGGLGALEGDGTPSPRASRLLPSTLISWPPGSSRLSRGWSAAHDLDFDLHRDDQNFTARLLESGTVMAAVTSRAAPVAGCRVSPLGSHALRGRRDAATTWRAGCRDGRRRLRAARSRAAPLVDFDRRDDLQTRWLRRPGRGRPSAPPRHYVPASHDFATCDQAGTRLGAAPGVSVRGQSSRTSASWCCSGGCVRSTFPCTWQQWNLRSPLLDAIAEELIAGGAAGSRLNPHPCP